MTELRGTRSDGIITKIGAFLDRLKTSAVVQSRAFLASLSNGLAFSWPSFDATAAAGTFILYLKNDSTMALCLDKLIVGTEEGTLFKLHFVTGIADTATQFQGTSLLSPATKLTTDIAESWGDGPVGTIVTAGVILPVRVGAADSKIVDLAEIGLKLGQGQAVAVEVDTDDGTPAIAEACLIGHFE